MMPFLLLIVGALLLVVAYQNTHGDLWALIRQDAPQYFRWALAIFAILALGWLPGMKTPSRLLLALVIIVVVLKSWTQIASGLTQFVQAAPPDTATGATTPSPAATFGPSPPSQTQIAGGPSGNPGGSMLATGNATAQLFAQVLQTPSVGFGGLA